MRLDGETVMVNSRVPVVGDWNRGIRKETVETLTASRRREEEWGDRDSCDQRNVKMYPATTAKNMAGPPQQKLVVGYALTAKKIKSFLQPKLEGLARKKGISFVAIDRNRHLDEQAAREGVASKAGG